MSEYILSCCSTADLTKEHFERRNIEYVCFHLHWMVLNTSTIWAKQFPLRTFMPE